MDEWFRENCGLDIFHERFQIEGRSRNFPELFKRLGRHRPVEGAKPSHSVLISELFHRCWARGVAKAPRRCLTASNLLGTLSGPSNWASWFAHLLVRARLLAELESLNQRQKQRILLGKFTSELNNALWTLDVLMHIPKIDPGECQRIVVAVDPSGA